METPWLVPLALLFGILLGAALVWVIVASARSGSRALAVASASVPDGVSEVIAALESAGIVLDASRNVITASPGALVFGIVWNQSLVHDELIDMVDHVRRTGETLTDDVFLSRGPFADPTLHLHVRAAPLGVRYVLLLAEDRTESYRLEEVRRDFIANISHELKTPIGAIGLLAEALAEASAEPEQVKRFAKRLTKEADRLTRITKEIIELSRLQAGEAISHPVLVDVGDVVATAIDENHVQADKQHVQLVKGGAKHATVSGDPALLRVALHNLIANAIQYSPEGSRVGVGVRVDNGTVEIAVTDQGIGIPEEERDRVFERFYRIDPARSRHTGGTGLGLAIVKHVVQNHGGDVRVWSQPGSGSTFTIRLPETPDPALALEA
jgi:two-component system sensor histidine kinase SenX3